MDSTQTGVSQGKTYYSEAQTVPTTYTQDTTKLEGKVVWVEDREVDSGGNRGALRSGRMLKTTIVRNDSTGSYTLPARTAAAWKTGYRGRRVDSHPTTNGGEIAGIVDPHLINRASEGARKGDLFLLYDVSGPVEAKTSPSAADENVFTEGSFVGALSAASSQAVTAGRVAVYGFTATSTATTTGTAAPVFKNVKAQAMSARTTANTNVAVLIGIV